MSTIHWGIIGCGNVTEVKSGPAFQKAEGSALVAVMRRDAVLAEDYARRHNVPRWYTDANALIADKDVDAVYIATPPGSHELYAMKVAAAGKPCYVEKPMARNTAEAQRMVAAFESKNLPLFVAYYRRALPRFLKVREIIQSGVLGTPLHVRYLYQDSQSTQAKVPLPWRFDPAQSGGGLFLDLGSHALDLMDFFFGPLQNMKGRAKRKSPHFNVEDWALVRVKSETLRAVTLWSFTEEDQRDLFAISGRRAHLCFSCFGNEPLQLQYADGRTESFDLPNPPHVQQPLIQSIVDDLLGRGTCESTGHSALRTQIVMDEALIRYYGGREGNFWSRPWPRDGS
jgi:predicted dehydrogenase